MKNSPGKRNIKEEQMSDSTTKKDDSKGTEKPVDYYMLHGDGRKYSREEIMAKTMPCKEGVTNRFVPDPMSRDFVDMLTRKRLYVRNDPVVPKKKGGDSKWFQPPQHPDVESLAKRWSSLVALTKGPDMFRAFFYVR